MDEPRQFIQIPLNINVIALQSVIKVFVLKVHFINEWLKTISINSFEKNIYILNIHKNKQ